ncbi:MAG: DNA polymerase III subunit chi [Gammaproteobacteria bacterium]|nr:DNA polymerase III subunit chi [Gammaproteobacteria bacterium]
MPEVGFYVLTTDSLAERYQFACKLIEKAYRSGVFPYVLTDNPEQSRQIDDLLWTFRAGSFIPHQLFTGDMSAEQNVILIGSDQPPEGWQKTVINLSSHCPQTYQQAERILEILDSSEDCKAAGRSRYRQYQQAEIDITTHKI